MAEVVVNKRVPGKLYHKPGIFFCKDCGEEVERKGTSHKRCEDCAKESMRDVDGKRFKRLFPYCRPDMKWVMETLIDGRDYYARKNLVEETARKLRRELKKDLCGPSPCSTCRYEAKCAADHLMCKAYHLFINSDRKNPTWGRRSNPGKYYYRKNFSDGKEAQEAQT